MMQYLWHALVLGSLFAMGAVTATADPERDRLMRYGEQLAQECVSCHRRDGKDVGIPGILSLSEAEFINAMMLYKTGRRQNKVMVSVSASLDDAQIQALAIYFAALGRQ
jgi:cytochrome c553